jgi:hypothetical protein
VGDVTLSNGQREERMVATAVDAIRTAWPLVGIGFAVAINAVWIGALGYGISKLL